jgi:hypothetical protein
MMEGRRRDDRGKENRNRGRGRKAGREKGSSRRELTVVFSKSF